MNKKLTCACSLILAVLFIAGCFASYEEVLDPPSWIMGTWTSSYSGITFRFYSDNVKYEDETIIDFKRSYTSDMVSDSSTDTVYRITVQDGAQITEYVFTKSDDSNLSYAIYTDGALTRSGLLSRETTTI